PPTTTLCPSPTLFRSRWAPKGRQTRRVPRRDRPRGESACHSPGTRCPGPRCELPSVHPRPGAAQRHKKKQRRADKRRDHTHLQRSEEHTSELQSRENL